MLQAKQACEQDFSNKLATHACYKEHGMAVLVNKQGVMAIQQGIIVPLRAEAA
jgi:hypothetical protein